MTSDEARQMIPLAQRVADRLGEDRNDHWTAFGPTNVRIHATSSAMELGDPIEVINQASTVDLKGLPDELRGRRSQLHIDLAWGYSQQKNEAAATLALLEAERIAPDAVRYSNVARNVVTASAKRAKRRGAVPDLDGLAQRIGVVV